MRCLLFTLVLLLLSSPFAYGQQQYTEGACILLDQQIQRFSHRPQSSSYRNAKREYEQNCSKPTRAEPGETAEFRDTAPAKPAPRPASSDVAVPKKSERKEPEIKQPTDSAPALVSEQVQQQPLSAKPLSAETATPEVAEGEQQVTKTAEPEVAISADEGIVADTGFQFDALLIQIVNNLPLIFANIFALLLAVFLLTNWLGLNLPGFKGIFAEYKLNRLLRWRLARGYRHFRKLKLRTAKDELVVIDHLVLSPFGIFVIMVKGYRGSVFGSESEANWTRQYFGNTKQFMNPLHQNFKNVAAVKHLLQLQGNDVSQHVHSVIAFSRLAQFKTEMSAHVTYVDATSGYIKQFSEPCFDDEQLNRYAALFRQASTDS